MIKSKEEHHCGAGSSRASVAHGCLPAVCPGEGRLWETITQLHHMVNMGHHKPSSSHTRTHSCTVPATGLTYCCVVCEGGFVFISGLIFFFKFMIYLFILFLNLGWVGIFSAQTLKKALICIGTGILSVSILILLLLIGSDQYYYWYYCQDMWLKSFSPSHK